MIIMNDNIDLMPEKVAKLKLKISCDEITPHYTCTFSNVSKVGQNKNFC